ncbi:head maturation protease, ClpP-related [Lentisphaerota bacterium WC36G]|nr:Clp protease ClpP [Lentisphaerae bacterium WC36]
MKTWFQVQNKADNSQTSEVYLFDDIGGWGVTASEFVVEVKAALNNNESETLEVHINSCGGSIFEGIAIYHFLKNLKQKVTVVVDGLAASIASVIAMAGDEIIMPENSYLMIHNGWGVSVGDADKMRSYADLLDKLGDTISSIYASRTGIEQDELKQMMSDETWLNGTEALEFGFATSNTSAINVAASCRIKNFNNVPAEYKNLFSDNSPNLTPPTTIQTQNKTQNNTGEDDEMNIEEHQALMNAAQIKFDEQLQAKEAKIVELQNAITKKDEEHATTLQEKAEENATLQAKVTEYEETFENSDDDGTGSDIQTPTGRDALVAQAAAALKK